MKKLVLFLSIGLLALLVACDGTTITVNPPQPLPTAGSSVDNPFDINISANNQTPSDTFALTGGNNFYYRIKVPGDTGGDGVWFELAPAGNSSIANIADIVWVEKDSQGVFEERLRSIGPESFGSPSSYASLNELDTAAINPVPVDEAVECRGPCLFIRLPANRDANVTYDVYIVVRAKAGSSINYQLYTYAASYYDATESINNQCSTLGIQSITSDITVIGTEPDYVGAIEAISDVDCFTSNDKVNASVRGATIELPQETTIAITADFYIGASSTPFESCTVSPTNRTCSVTRNALEMLVKVRPANSQAAPFVNAKYELRFTQ